MPSAARWCMGLACPEGLEPPTCCLEGSCSIRLSYGQMGAGLLIQKRPTEWAFLFFEEWSERRDSNSRPSAPKADALPGCATLRLSRDCTCWREVARTPSALSAFLVLRLAKLGLARLVVRQGFSCIGQHGHTALYRRTRGDGVEPLLEPREVGPVNALVLPTAQPREDGDVGHAVLVAGDEFLVGQLLVHHAIEPPGFVGVAVDGVLDLLRRIQAEVVRLAQHRAHASHLEHQPLQHLELRAVRLRQELAGPGREVEQDGPRLEQADGLAIGPLRIDQRGNLVVRADLEKGGLELIALADVDRVHLPVATESESALLQHDVDLVSVGRGP